MPGPQTATDGGYDRDGETDRADTDARDDDVSLFATSAVRIALVLVGLVITVFALGQAVGVDFLGMIADALSTQTGQWLLVALVGIALIVVAQRSFATRD